jgi:hypothetical protein
MMAAPTLSDQLAASLLAIRGRTIGTRQFAGKAWPIWRSKSNRRKWGFLDPTDAAEYSRLRSTARAGCLVLEQD